MDQIIYENNRKKTPGYAVPIRVLLVRRPGGNGRFVRVEKWDAEQKLYVPDRIPWPWDAVQALRKENQKLRARLHRAESRHKLPLGGETGRNEMDPGSALTPQEAEAKG